MSGEIAGRSLSLPGLSSRERSAGSFSRKSQGLEKSVNLVLTGGPRLLVCVPAFLKKEPKNPSSVRRPGRRFGAGVFALFPEALAQTPKSVLYANKPQ